MHTLDHMHWTYDKVVWRRPVDEDVHKEETMWMQPTRNLPEEHLIVLHMFKHLRGNARKARTYREWKNGGPRCSAHGRISCCR